MKYVVFNAVLPAGDMSVQSYLMFPDHLNHYDVAHNNVNTIAEGYGTTAGRISFVGAGFVDQITSRCWGYSDSLNLHSRGQLDTDVILASMLHFEDAQGEAHFLERIHAHASKARSIIGVDLSHHYGAKFLLTSEFRVPRVECIANKKIHDTIPAFSLVIFRGVTIEKGGVFFVLEHDELLYNFQFGVIYALVTGDKRAHTLFRKHVRIECQAPLGDLGVNSIFAINDMQFDDEHRPDVPGYVTMQITVNGESKVVGCTFDDLIKSIEGNPCI